MRMLRYPPGICFIVSVVCIVLLSGCVVQSVNPFYTEASVLAYPDIEGSWILLKSYGEPVKDSSKVLPWKIAADKLTAYDDKGIR